MRFVHCACACVALLALVGTARCDGPIDRLNDILESVIRRTDAIVLGTESRVVSDLDRTLALIRRRTIQTGVRGDIADANRRNRLATDALLQRTVTRTLRAEREFSIVYRRAVVDVQQQVSGSVLEPIVLSALRRIDQIVNRAILRINRILLAARERISWLTNVSALYLQQLHDRAERADPPNDEYYQRQLVQALNRSQGPIRSTLLGHKGQINDVVRSSEDLARRETNPGWAIGHANQDVQFDDE